MASDDLTNKQAARAPYVAWLALACMVACMQPDDGRDEFTGAGSTVTGDSERPDDEVDDDDADDDAPQNDDAGSEPKDDGDDAPGDDDADDGPPAVDAGARSDAAVAASDGGPRPAGGDGGTRDAGAGDARAPVPPEGASDAGSGPNTDGPAPTKLSFSVTTVTMRGRYSPQHVLAIWITDGQGKFVKTLARHARIRARYLTGWNAAASGNLVDAVSGATLRAHTTHQLSWNLTDASKMPVPDGEYKIVLELTENDRTGVTTSVPFTKGPAPSKLMPPDAPNFTKMTLALE